MSKCNCGSEPLEFPPIDSPHSPFSPHVEERERKHYPSYFNLLQESKRNIPTNNIVTYLVLAFIIFAIFWFVSMSKYSLKR